MKKVIALLIVWLLTIAQPVWGNGSNYTNRNNVTASCELFAKDAYQASVNLVGGVKLHDLLELIERSPVSENQKHRAFHAIQLVWKEQLDNPLMAYSLAMGLCLKPKKEMAPIAEPWLISPRTSREYF